VTHGTQVSLTDHVKARRSSVRLFMDEWFPAAAWKNPFGLAGTREFLNELNTGFRRSPIIRPAAPIDYQLVGTAIDFRIRYYFRNTPPRDLLTSHALSRSRRFPGALELFTDLEFAIDRAGPVLRRLSLGDEDVVNRCCYVLASIDRRRHGGVAGPGEVPLDAANTRVLDELGAGVPAIALDDMRALSWLFWDNSQPVLDLVRHHGMTVVSGPRFGAAGRLIGGAVGDLLLGGPTWGSGMLIDVKTSITPGIVRSHVLQILGYALLDWENTHSIDMVGVYLARSGDWVVWPVEDLLNYLGDGARILGTTRRRTLPLEEWRKRFREAVGDAAYLGKHPSVDPVATQREALRRATPITETARQDDPCSLCGREVANGWQVPLSRNDTLLCDRCLRLARELTAEGRSVLGLWPLDV